MRKKEVLKVLVVLTIASLLLLVGFGTSETPDSEESLSYGYLAKSGISLVRADVLGPCGSGPGPDPCN